jgi:hypothetical protein
MATDVSARPGAVDPGADVDAIDLRSAIERLDVDDQALLAIRYVLGLLDSVFTHKTPDVQAWLGRHKRFTFHFTPTSASWMNQVETWFGILTRQAIRRGSFESVRVLTAVIERFTREWNAGATPFTWVRTADEILAKAVRKTQADSGARH